MLCKQKNQVVYEDSIARSILKKTNVQKNYEIVGKYIYIFNENDKKDDIFLFDHLEDALVEKNKNYDFKTPGIMRIEFKCISVGPISFIAEFTGNPQKNFIPFSISELESDVLSHVENDKQCLCNVLTEKYEKIAKIPEKLLCI